jgi:DNA recombination protein RmuC
MDEIAIIAILVLLVLNLVILLVSRARPGKDTAEIIQKISVLENYLAKIESNLKEDFKINRAENSNIAKDNRTELNNTLKEFKTELTETLRAITEQNQKTLITAFKGFQENFDKNVESFNNLQRQKFGQLDEKQTQLIAGTEKKLEEMRLIVDEKLQKTLNERLGQSFERVGKQLEDVHKGLGEMKTLAQDVGGLKNALGNVKLRGGIGEFQLAMLLEQILAPQQYQANVKTKQGSNDNVEFAIKLPGRDDGNSIVWLPIDAKFPKDVYEQLQSAHDIGDPVQIDSAQKNLENTIKKMARDIHDKYLDPPNTTDFGIMFLPFEGIYAEVVRKASLLEELQRDHKVVVTGPTTLAAILNCLNMGFKTLAIQKNSGEVWKLLGSVKKEFESFGGLIEKAHSDIQKGLNQLDETVGKRTRAIQRKLRDVETLGEAETMLLPDFEEGELEA